MPDLEDGISNAPYCAAELEGAAFALESARLAAVQLPKHMGGVAYDEVSSAISHIDEAAGAVDRLLAAARRAAGEG